MSKRWTCGNCGTQFVVQPAIGPVCPECAWWLCGTCGKWTYRTHFQYRTDGEARVAYDRWLQLHAASERDRASQGSKAAATCPNCAHDTAIPSFAEVKGNTHVLYTCIRCGEDFL